MSDKFNKSKDKYNIRLDITSLNASSATELTGLIPSAPKSDDEIESYYDLLPFSSKDIVVEGYDEDRNQTLNAKKTGNNFTNKKR